MELIITEKVEKPEKPEKRTVCLNMIVKNESHIIVETLEMLCNKIDFSYWVISDTGSTDNTRELIQGFFNKKQIPGELHRNEWKNFAYNRTLALNAAFGKTDLLLVFDADDELHGDFNIPLNDTADAYLMQFGSEYGVSYSRILLVNNKVRWEYQSVIHEYINCLKPNPDIKYLVGDYYVVSGRRGSRSQDPNKYLKDAKVLEEAYEIAVKENDKLYLRYAFYCGNSYRDANMPESAIKWYKTVLGLENWEQEKYNSCLYLYNCYKALNKQEEGFYYLIESFKYDTERLECLYELITHYLHKNMPLVAYNYYRNCKSFFENKYLKAVMGDKLFIEVDKYNIFLPFLMIIISDKIRGEHPEANETIAKMYEIIFTKKYITGVQEHYIGNTLFNLQFFIDVCIEKIPNFINLFQEYINFLLEKKISLEKYSHFMGNFDKYNITYTNKNKIISIPVAADDSFVVDKCKKSRKILFYTGYNNLEWNYTYCMNNALGGSESAVAYLSKMFPANYEIYVGGTVREEKVDNITYVNFHTMGELVKTTHFHTVIVSRYLGFYEIFNKAHFYQSYIWGHDVALNSYGTNIDVNELLAKWDNKITGCICQTEWHASVFRDNYSSLRNKIHIINNGINVSQMNHKPIKKINSFLYTSCTERGLDRVLELWPTILEKMPDAELSISGYNPFPHNELENNLKKIMDNYPDSIRHCGNLNRDELYKLMSTTEYWLYPTCWPETSCITALEMLANEVICFYYPLAGLNDTLGSYGKQIARDNEIDTILNLTGQEKCRLKKLGREYAFSCSWENRAKIWSERLLLSTGDASDTVESADIQDKLWIFYFEESFEIQLILDYLLNLNYSSNYSVEITNDKQYILDKTPARLTFVSFVFDTDILTNEVLKKCHCEISLLNTEPLNLPNRLYNFIQSCSKISEKNTIYDYSKSNIQILRDNNVKNPMEYLPYKTSEKELAFLSNAHKTSEKTYDFGFLYNWKEKKGTQDLPITPPRRNKILEWLQNRGYTINIIAGFDEKRDIELAKCKTILNIHGQINENPDPSANECSNIFEHIRCDRLLEAGFQILSETSYQLDSEFIQKYPNLKIINYNDFFDERSYDNLTIRPVQQSLKSLKQQGQQSLKQQTNAKKYCFIHSCHISTLGTKKLEEHINLLNSSGLINELECVFINNVGIPISSDFCKKYGPKYELMNYSKNIELYENPTLNKIKRFSENNKDCYILYLHTKGVSYNKHHPWYTKVRDWNALMTYFLVEKYSSCFEKLVDYDSVGCNYRNKITAPNIIWTYGSHYSGNFWWSKTNYLKTLPLLDESVAQKMAPEFWLFNNKHAFYILYNSNIEHYYHEYPREKYYNKTMKIVDKSFDNDKLCFILANNYMKTSIPIIQQQLDTIRNWYANSFIIISINDADNLDEIYKTFMNYTNLIILSNTSDHKYELGAFYIAINWLIDTNNLVFKNYIFMQNNLVLQHKYNFDVLQKYDIKCCRFFPHFENINCISYAEKHNRHLYKNIPDILKTLNIKNEANMINICCNFNCIINDENILKFYEYIKLCKITNKYDYEVYERVMGYILDEICICDYNFNETIEEY